MRYLKNVLIIICILVLLVLFGGKIVKIGGEAIHTISGLAGVVYDAAKADKNASDSKDKSTSDNKKADTKSSDSKDDQESDSSDSSDASDSSKNSDEKSDTDIYYYYTLLEDNDSSTKLDAYEEILAGLKDNQEDIRIDDLESQQAEKVFRMVYSDHPELFWVNNAYTLIKYIDHVVIEPEYNCSGKEKQAKKKKIESKVQAALEHIDNGDTTYGRISNTFTYVIDHVYYDSDASDNQNLYSALVNEHSVCAGYARMTQYLLQRMNIQALYVTGTASTSGGETGISGDHAWNIVRCDGNYYQLDCTFGDITFASGGEEIEDIPEELAYNYTYLCCDDDEMYRDHAADDELEIPDCTSKKYNYYVYHRLYFDSVSQQMREDLLDNIESGERCWSCQFSSHSAYEEFKSEIADGYYSNQILDHVDGISRVRAYYIYDDSNYVIKLWY